MSQNPAKSGSIRWSRKVPKPFVVLAVVLKELGGSLLVDGLVVKSGAPVVADDLPHFLWLGMDTRGQAENTGSGSRGNEASDGDVGRGDPEQSGLAINQFDFLGSSLRNRGIVVSISARAGS